MYTKAGIYGLVLLGELVAIRKVFNWHCLVVTIYLLVGYLFSGIRGITGGRLEVASIVSVDRLID